MKFNLGKVLIALTLFVIVGAIVLLVLSGSESAERATVRINDRSLRVLVADNAWERRQGLSGRTPQSLDAEGMLFVFPDDDVRHFWMHGMLFPLDVLWIKDGKVVSIDYGIAPPAPGQEPARMTSSPLEADMVLEVPAGLVARLGLTPGMLINVELP